MILDQADQMVLAFADFQRHARQVRHEERAEENRRIRAAAEPTRTEQMWLRACGVAW